MLRADSAPFVPTKETAPDLTDFQDDLSSQENKENEDSNQISVEQQ
jgi:hypothetical protein